MDNKKDLLNVIHYEQLPSRPPIAGTALLLVLIELAEPGSFWKGATAMFIAILWAVFFYRRSCEHYFRLPLKRLSKTVDDET